MTVFEAIIIAIVEGITEFLPVSSTGHMIITSSLLGIQSDSFTKTFEIAVQLGAILAVVVLYWKKFFDFSRWQFYIKLIFAVIPALVLGILFSNNIDALLESPLTVAIMLLLGGIVLLFIDRAFTTHTIDREENISYPRALVIGIWQCLAMIPGVSRSAASIIGGMQQKLTRKLAAEFSFFLAVPTMMAATGYKLLKGYKDIHSEQIKLLVIGNAVAFIVAILAIKFFIGFLQKHGFRLFGVYRIIAGIVLLILIWQGYI
ncbi:MAG TPA: undecaprenyl-diphosphate phosphatase [Chitinophagaceae bacterium]|nr:undecaprenyl-diphosphate phosphatase [Chitinophagaceae bacterium]